jgi:alpha-beta hydrolase superfamily lysophospholipase
VQATKPARTGEHAGLVWNLWLPETRAESGVVVIHGAGSSQESHYGFARAAVAAGLAALTFDQRGHGQSPGRLDGRAVQDVVAMADLLREELDARAQPAAAPIALRGSSLGGYLALRAAGPARAAAVVAICPASPAGLRRAIGDQSVEWNPDPEGFAAVLDEEPLTDAVASLALPVLLLHAQGDERVPVQHSRELAAAASAEGSRLIEVPGGHHRSIQHDDELQAVSLRFLERTLLPETGVSPRRGAARRCR